MVILCEHDTVLFVDDRSWVDYVIERVIRLIVVTEVPFVLII